MDEIKELPSGKLSPKALERNVLRYVGAERKELLVGPAVGEDAAVIEWPEVNIWSFIDPIVGVEKAPEGCLYGSTNDIASGRSVSCSDAHPSPFMGRGRGGAHHERDT